MLTQTKTSGAAVTRTYRTPNSFSKPAAYSKKSRCWDSDQLRKGGAGAGQRSAQWLSGVGWMLRLCAPVCVAYIFLEDAAVAHLSHPLWALNKMGAFGSRRSADSTCMITAVNASHSPGTPERMLQTLHNLSPSTRARTHNSIMGKSIMTTQ